jgi:acetyl-CoA carboxylase beta subunit
MSYKILNKTKLTPKQEAERALTKCEKCRAYVYFFNKNTNICPVCNFPVIENIT